MHLDSIGCSWQHVRGVQISIETIEHQIRSSRAIRASESRVELKQASGDLKMEGWCLAQQPAHFGAHS